MNDQRALVGRSLLWGAALLVAGCSDLSRPRANPTPIQPSITSAAWPHEPTGATLFTDQPFDARATLGWGFDSTSLGRPTIVADASAPYTPQNVVEFAYPIGFPGGGWAPGAEWTTLPSASRVYAGLWWKSSSPWQGVGPVLAYLQTATGHLSLAMDGPAGGPYQVYVHGPTDLFPNQTPAVTLSPGTWYQVEWLVDNANPANAHIQWWVGGQLVGDYTNIQLPSDPFTYFRLEPSWGDASSKTENDYVHYDHAYISGNWPSGITYYRVNFADQTLGPLSFSSYGGTGTWASSTDYHEPDSPFSIKFTVPVTRPDDSAELIAQFGPGGVHPTVDPTLDQDLFQQIRFVIAPGAMTAVGGPTCTDPSSQFKLHKSTYGAVGSNTNGWVMTDYSPCNGFGGIITEAEMYNAPGAFDDIRVWPNPPFQEGVVYDVVYRYHRYTAEGVGTVAVWVNGTKVVDTPKRAHLGFTGGSTAGLRLRDGAEYLQSPHGPFSVYVLFTQATNFPIGGATASP
jgi:hypothetical protein